MVDMFLNVAIVNGLLGFSSLENYLYCFKFTTA